MIEVTIDGITYQIDEEKQTASVSKADRNLVKGAISLPSCITHNDHQYPVTSIAEWAFSNCSALTSITIPESVTSIGDWAFSDCSGLTSITIPESVTSIGNGAFQYCSALTSINIPDGVTSIRYAFRGCSRLTSITIPESVTSIGDSAFHGCFGLTSITIPESVTSIGDSAFHGCFGLTSITIPESVTSIENWAFSGCSGLTSITIPDGVTSIGDWAFCYVSNIAYHGSATGSPWGAWSINGYVEGYLVYDSETKKKLLTCSHSAIGEIAIPESITSIGDWAFSDCSGLTSITIPDGVTSIGYGTFSGCSGLTSITIPDGVTSIGDRAFESCSGLTSITTPDGVTSIGKRAFESCSGLTSITIPESVTSIGDSAFHGCSELTSITIPDGVTNIGDYAFCGCSGLISITIPESVTSIGNSAFHGCFGLTSITIPESATSIGYEAFRGCSGLTSITIPKSVMSIGYEAFCGCSGLTSITIPDGVTSVWSYAFYGCKNLLSADLPRSITEIGKDIFSDCKSLTIIRVPRGKKETYCKMGLENQRDIMQEEVCTIENVHYALDYSAKTAMVIAHDTDSGMQYEGSVVVPAKIKVEDTEFAVTEIEANAFAGCEALLSITLPKGMTGICTDAFRDCENLTVIRVPKGTKANYCEIGLEPWREIVQEPQEEEYTILLNIARGYESGIGVAKNLAQAVVSYIQAADKGCAEAAFHLGELYETGQGLPQDPKQAADWYAKATALYHPLSAARQKACLQQIEEDELRMATYIREQKEQLQAAQNRPSARPAIQARYLFFDTETNGLPASYHAGIEDTANWPRMLQLGWILTDAAGTVLKKRNALVYPKGFEVNSEVTQLTGITTQQLRTHGEALNDVLAEFMEDVKNADCLVGHNVNFDMKIVGCELHRAGRDVDTISLQNRKQCCTMEQTVNFCALPNPKSRYSWSYKYPKLSELYTKLFGHTFAGAHDAMADVTATKDCFFELKRQGIHLKEAYPYSL